MNRIAKRVFLLIGPTWCWAFAGIPLAKQYLQIEDGDLFFALLCVVISVLLCLIGQRMADLVD